MEDQNIINLREEIGKEVTGNPNFKNEDFKGLDAQDKITITNRMKAIIAENPDDFNSVQIAIANTPDIEDIDEFTFGEAVEAAAEGAAEGASKFNSGLKMFLTLGTIAAASIAIINLTKLATKK